MKSKPEKHRLRFEEVAAGSFEKSFSIHSQTVDLEWSFFQCVIFANPKRNSITNYFLIRKLYILVSYHVIQCVPIKRILTTVLS